ncbi:MAG: hypothetical protein AAF490_05180 [Chloroflexota bacterium]
MGLMPISGQTVPKTPISHAELSELREQLIKFGAWPEAGDQYLSLIAHTLWDRATIQPKDYQWIPKVAEDVVNGVDIGLQYPSFFQKLLANSELRGAFVERLRKLN